MRTLLVLLLLLTVAFAGCASKDKGADGSEGDLTGSSATSGTKTSSGTGTSSTSGTSTGTTTSGTDAPNTPPTAQLSAATAEGSLQVNFTADGSDADGDGLSWTLDYGDASANETGTAFPQNLTHTYAAAGTFTATLTVSDGRLNATSSVNVTLAGGAAATQDFEGEWAVGNVDAPAFASIAGGCDAVGPLDGVYMAMFDVDAATIGKAYSATIAAVTTGDSIVAWEVKFLDADCGILEGPYVDGAVPITGTVPAGAVHAWMSSDGGAQMTGTYHAG